jgi:putative molybdopterin biosynthesis protein
MRLTPTITWLMEGSPGDPLDSRVLPLLSAIAATGSLAAAVAQRALSYRAAWGLLRDCEARFGVPLVELERGRGARLAPAGTRLLAAQAASEQSLARLLPGLAVELGDAPARPTRAKAVTLRLAASHDLALVSLRDGLAGAAGMRLDVSFMGSLHALQQFAEGRVVVAGFHVALESGDVAPFRRWLDARRDRLIRFVDREQGLILPRGNPSRVRNFRDIARKTLRFVNRQAGSGTRLMIDRILAGEGVSADAVPGFSQEEFTHAAIAATVASGAADAGFGLRAVAAERGLAFVSLVQERYYLAVRAADLETAGIARLLQLLRSPAFARLASSYAGYAPLLSGSVAGVGTLGVRGVPGRVRKH